MELKELQKHIYTLATLEETDSPVLSCYLNLDMGVPACLRLFHQGTHFIRTSLPEENQPDFDAALLQIDKYLETGIDTGTRGAAIFVRAGERPFFLPLQFQMPLPYWVSVGSVPNIFHLVELKDTYDRYEVLIVTEEHASILEVSLGRVSRELWQQRPELRRHVGQGWVKGMYQRHYTELTPAFLEEIVQIVEQRMMIGGHSHLILAGDKQMVAQVRAALPRYLVDLLETVSTGGAEKGISDIVSDTLAAFIEQEERESHSFVERLQQQIEAGGLAVAGLEPSLEALEQGRADMLIVGKEMLDVDTRERLTRLAERNGCRVEVVNESDLLKRLGGVGCLLLWTDEQMWNTSNEILTQPPLTKSG
jgi:hypothetical protein